MADALQGTITAFGGGVAAVALTLVAKRRLFRAQGRSVEVRGELQIVDAAKGIMDELRTELHRQADSHRAEIDRITARLTRIEAENVGLERENHELRARCTSLEDQLRAIRSG